MIAHSPARITNLEARLRRQTISVYSFPQDSQDSIMTNNNSNIENNNNASPHNNAVTGFFTPRKSNINLTKCHTPATEPPHRRRSRFVGDDSVAFKTPQPVSVVLSTGKQKGAAYNLHQPQGNASYGYKRSGYLLKKSEARVRVKPWRKRRCEIADGSLFIFHSDKTKTPTKLNLLTCQVKSYVYDDKYCFDLISFNRTYHFQAENENDLTAWVSVLINCKEVALKAQLNHHNHASRLHQHSNGNKRCLNQLAMMPAHMTDGCADSLYCSQGPLHDADSSQLQQSIIAHIMSMKGNQHCVDCGADDSSWLSTNLGILVCIECSGIHREMGVQTSRIQSLILDHIGTSHLLIAKNMGNQLFNDVYEANLEEFDFPSKPLPHSPMDVKSEFIRAKYLHKVFANKSNRDSNELQKDFHRALIDCDLSKILQLFGEDIEFESIGNQTNAHVPVIHFALDLQAHIAGDRGQERSLPIVDFLVQNTSNLNQQNEQGDTALHLCVKLGLKESMKLLLRSGADASITNNSGLTPLGIAQSQGGDSIMLFEILSLHKDNKRTVIENVDIDWGVELLHPLEISSASEIESDDTAEEPSFLVQPTTPAKSVLKTTRLGLSSRRDRSSSLSINCEHNEGRYTRLDSEEFPKIKEPEDDEVFKPWTNNKQLTALFSLASTTRCHSSNILPFDDLDNGSPKIKALRSLVTKPQKILKVRQLWQSSTIG